METITGWDLASRFRRVEAACKGVPELDSIAELAKDAREVLKEKECWFHRYPHNLERIGEIADGLENLLRQRAEAS